MPDILKEQERLSAEKFQELIGYAKNIKTPFEYLPAQILLQNVEPNVQLLEMFIKKTREQILNSKAQAVMIDNKKIFRN